MLKVRAVVVNSNLIGLPSSYLDDDDPINKGALLVTA